MIIKSKNFVLRYARKSDLDSYYKSKRNDKEIDKGFMRYKFPYSLSAAKKDLDYTILGLRKKSQENFIIDINGKAVGEVSFSHIVPRLSGKIGYWIGKEYRGKGIMSEAVRLAVNRVFEKYGLRRIYGKIIISNKASVRVLEKAGFKLEGIQRKACLKYGKYFDEYLYAKVR